jgi:hypothetical protein
MPSAHPQPPGTLFKILDVPAAHMHEYPNLIADLSSGVIDVALIRNVFSAQTMDTVRERMEHEQHGMLVSPQSTPDVSVPQVTLFGQGITPNDVDRRSRQESQAAYHANALTFREDCRRLFAGVEDYESRIDALFSTLAHGATSTVPMDPAGRLFAPSTVRRLSPGAEMNLHVGNYFLSTPAYQHLRPQLCDYDQLSFFLPIATPADGGEIEVFELTFNDPRMPKRKTHDVVAATVEATMRFEPFAPQNGDMFLFNGGRFYHRVEWVRGPRARWTIGGFVALSRDFKTVYRWS